MRCIVINSFFRIFICRIIFWIHFSHYIFMWSTTSTSWTASKRITSINQNSKRWAISMSKSTFWIRFAKKCSINTYWSTYTSNYNKFFFNFKIFIWSNCSVNLSFTHCIILRIAFCVALFLIFWVAFWLLCLLSFWIFWWLTLCSWFIFSIIF